LIIFLTIMIFILLLLIIFLSIKLYQVNILYNTLHKDHEFWSAKFNQQKDELKFYKDTLIKIINTKNINIFNNNLYIGKKVLIGDYDEETSKHTKQALEKFGIIVSLVSSGTDILKKITDKYHYDLIITNNVFKNGCDGLSTMLKLKQLNNFTTPVIICTSSTDKEFFINNCKFDDYLQKPVSEKDINRILQKFF